MYGEPYGNWTTERNWLVKQLFTGKVIQLQVLRRESVNERFNNLQKDLLQTEEDISFLYCNAHFLLGLSHAVTGVFNQRQQLPIGRETIAKFLVASKGEHPVLRYIREACACLGPRGDEKFGCRENWLAFCILVDQQSAITSFKSNRFNNLFEASAGLHFNQRDISTFMDTSMSSPNWKQEGILLDRQSMEIDNYLVALGLLFYRLTEPYWQLLGTDIIYLDFYKAVFKMKQFLTR